MRVQFRPEALEAKAWYEAHVPGLGFEFARALEAAIQSAVRNPLAFTTVEGECRRVLMRRFPYSVVFRPGPKSMLIVAVFHHRREPSVLAGRVGG
jgi:toxin ParE1/3/4